MGSLKRVSSIGLPLLLVALVVAGCATTVTSPELADNTLTVVGVGRVAITPNLAVLSVGVNSRGTTVGEATADAASKMNAVLARIKSLGVADADVATVLYSIDPRVSMVRPDEPSRVVGYQVHNLVQVTVRKPETVGAILDGVTGAGANIVRDVQFTRTDAAKAQAEARAAAVEDALVKVRQLAAAAGMRLGEALSIRESPSGRPIMRGSGLGPSGSGTPAEPGQLEVVVSIELRHSIRR